MSGQNEQEAERAELSGVRHTWEQRADESGQAFEAFKVFRDAGVTRTVSAAYRQKTGRAAAKMASGTWLAWAKKYEWYARAADFDRYVEAIERREEEREFAARRRLWVTRRGEIQDEAWRVAEALTSKGKEILALPLTETVETVTTADEESKTVTTKTVTTKPLRVSLAEATAAFKLADTLKRLAANMATERIVVRSAAAEQAETIEDARRAFREAREMFGESESIEETARNIAAAYALDAAQILEGYDEGQKLATQSVS